MNDKINHVCGMQDMCTRRRGVKKGARPRSKEREGSLSTLRDELNGYAALAVGISSADAPVHQCYDNGKRPTIVAIDKEKWWCRGAKVCLSAT